MADFRDVARLFRKLSTEEQEKLDLLSGYVNAAELKYP
jgi:hypothetical protein